MSRAAHGFTLIEMLTTIAALVIVLGLMVSLSRHVRSRSAQRLTGDLLQNLDRLMSQYQRETGELPPVDPALPQDRPFTEDTLRATAPANNRSFIQHLRGAHNLTDAFTGLSVSYFDGQSILDAWGHPIVFVPGHNPHLGMAPGGRFFFVSPGPDGKFFTREDNLYSYERR